MKYPTSSWFKVLAELEGGKELGMDFWEVFGTFLHDGANRRSEDSAHANGDGNNEQHASFYCPISTLTSNFDSIETFVEPA